jgi:hypothetical protein
VEAPVTRLGDRAALVAARADEEDARHGAMLVGGWRSGRRVRSGM